MFKMRYWDREFSTARMQESDPFVDMVMVDGLIAPVRTLPPEIQKIIRREQSRLRYLQ